MGEKIAMNIKPILKRLANTFNQTDLAADLLLVPAGSSPTSQTERAADSVHLVVGYTGSPDSHTALDLTLWIAHQTRLATAKPVVVQVVYVVPPCPTSYLQTPALRLTESNSSSDISDWIFPSTRTPGTPATTGTLERPLTQLSTTSLLSEQYEQADQILWQARCLANEWRGSLKTHLRFGHVATELCQVAQEEAATLLVLGCSHGDHPLIRQMGSQFPCPVLGIPAVATGVNLELESV